MWEISCTKTILSKTIGRHHLKFPGHCTKVNIDSCQSNFHSIHFPFPRKIYQNGIVINSSDLGLWYLPTQILTTSVIWWGKNDRFISLHKSHLERKLTVQEFMNTSPSSDQSQYQSLVINTNCNKNDETHSLFTIGVYG